MSMAVISSDHPASSQEFTEMLALKLLQELANGVASFPQLAESMEGAWPPETLAALKSLLTKGQISRGRFDSIVSSTVVADSEQAGWRGFPLPEPHPLNYDWRFSASTITALVERIERAEQSSIALLGVPSLYRPLKESGRTVWLYDVNTGLNSGMSAEEASCFVCGNLQDATETRRLFDVAVADPPWYLEHYAAFFERMQDLLVPGGQALVSVLPTLTRPSAAADQREIVAIARGMGFDLDEVIRGTLGYDTPPFEAAALRSEGLVLPHWRKADLYSFRRARHVDRPSSAPFEPLEISERAKWTTFVFAGCSIAVKEIPSGGAEFTFHSCSSGGSATLQSVSRRSEARLKANLWSSKNHVLQASRTDCVNDLFSRCASGVHTSIALCETQKVYGLSDRSISELQRLLGICEECFK